MTGGGIYPALAVLQKLEKETESVLWVGSRSGMEETFMAQYKVPFKSISAAGVHGISLKELPYSIKQLFTGWQESKTIIQDFQPDVIFYTGGYIGIPMALASRKIPSVVFIPDIEPGLALKIIMRFAHSIAVSTTKTLPYIPKNKNTNVTGYPIRNEIKKWTRKNSRAHFKIPLKHKVLLVFGGSKGARSINQALLPVLNKLLDDMHVIHITGKDNWEDIQKDILIYGIKNTKKYHPFPFLQDDMGAAFAAADLTVCRAGASIIGELPYFKLPAVLVPYPHAWQYQKQNAEYLSQNNGALILEDQKLTEELYQTIIITISNKNKLELMRENMEKLSVENAEDLIADMILDVGHAYQGGGSK